MNKTAIIYSKSEARAMEPKDRPICYRVTSKIYLAAWDLVALDATINPDAAGKAVCDLCFAVAEEMERLGVTFEQINAEKPK